MLILVKTEGIGGPWNDISGATYSGKSYDFTPEDNSPEGIYLKPDGTKMYIIGSNANIVFQYSMSTPWDVSTGSYDSKSYNANTDFGGQAARDVQFKPDGTKMYLMGRQDKILHYTLSTPWDVSTATYTSGGDISLSAIVGANPHGFTFKSDGTRMLWVDAGTKLVYQYSLSSGWDGSTASYDSISLDINPFTINNAPRGMHVSPVGDKLYVTRGQTAHLYQFSLPSNWVLTGGSYDNDSINVSGQVGSANAVEFRPNGDSFYVLDAVSDDVFQYDM